MSPAVYAALHAILIAVLHEGGRTDLAIGNALRANPKLKPNECAIIVRLGYILVRKHRLLCALAALPESAPETPEDTFRLESAYAALDKRRRDRWPTGFSPEVAVRRAFDLAKQKPFVYHSLPDWLGTALKRDLGTAFDRVATALGDEPPCVIRVNTARATPAQLVKALEQQGIGTRPFPGVPDALETDDRHATLKSRSFSAGLYELQDAGSQRIAPLLGIAPGMNVIDACAGEGGKTLHLSNLMQGRGRLIALDVEPRKLEALKKRAERAGAANISTELIGAKTWSTLAGWADAVLIDAPCSGTGVLRRQPETRWRLTPESIAERVALQSRILDQAAFAVKRGGVVGYATCSLLADENAKQVARFLARHKGQFEPVSTTNILPGRDGNTDGFFCAVLRRL